MMLGIYCCSIFTAFQVKKNVFPINMPYYKKVVFLKRY
jgi:hypothetical protein